MNLEQIVLRLSRHPHSPLFARLAGEYLNSGRLSEARELCESGLREHPGYATGRLILARCRAAESRYREALDILRIASEWIPDSPILLGLQTAWEPLADGENDPVISEVSPPEEPAPKEPPVPVLEEAPARPRVEIAAAAIPGSMQSPVIKPSGSAGVEGRIVSRTLAEIYATQGAFGEAILTYRLLKRIRPELVPQIERRIGELEGLSQTKPPQRG
jgi:tetratricopeptide (TPR) repeat protein